jgi:signal transduction histidine kinase/CheY-like chemotaxis protein
MGSFYYVIKKDRLDPLRGAIDRALSHTRLMRENKQLLSELHHMNELLENKVQERTQQLEQANRKLTFERGELERTLDTLNQTQTRLIQAEKMASVGLLTAGVAHEINNPLAFLLPNFTLLEDLCNRLQDGEAKQKQPTIEEMLQLIAECREGLQRIRNIIQELGLFARKGDAVTESIALPRIVESILKLFSSQLRVARISLDLADVPAVAANAGQLRQVIMNLLLNATQAIPDEKKDGLITINAKQYGERVELTVKDNGVGIPAEDLSKVFDPFFTTKDVGQGTGMGLAISRQLVERMSGSIEVESEEGEGTMVLLTLPMWDEEKEKEMEQAEAPAAKQRTIKHKRGEQVSLLVVDDEPVFLASIKRVLAPRYEIACTQSGAATLEWLDQHDAPDVVLCDLIMPEMSGIELYHAIRERFPDVAERVIFITGGAITQEAREFMESEQHRVVEKPLDVKEIVEVIEGSLGEASSSD